MKTCKKITEGIAKVAEWIVMAAIAGLVIAIVLELVRRNFFNQSFAGNIQLCGIIFLWMAFIGLIPLYCKSGLMRLDFLAARVHGPMAQVLYFVNKGVSLMLGVVMVVAFIYQYPFVSTRTYQTFSVKVPYTVQYVPMMIAGIYIAVKTVEQVIERILVLTGRLPATGEEGAA
ncbi:MAG: TRAP transporter small permease subunit [Clostridia bacterium]|nr:TRAP transporter small permease subunit [Clostridia bacterium]